MYAIIDIESSGGKPGKEKIIEIAIFRFDGQQVVDQLISLVHCSGHIQPHVQKLTGITPNMLRRAPKFYELAKRIVQITEDAIMVGHNVGFDYRMLVQEFAALGYEFNRKTLDTIPLTQKLIPGLKSYGLENVCRELNIYNPQRHRAAGDARVTLELFKILLEKDQKKEILTLASPGSTNLEKHPASGKLNRLLDLVQPKPGVYYLRDQQGKILKTGFSKNLFAELHQLFLLDDTLSSSIADLQTELTGNDLISKIKLYVESRNFSLPATYAYHWLPEWHIVFSGGRYGLVRQKSPPQASLISLEKRHQAVQCMKKLLDQPLPDHTEEAIDRVKQLVYERKDMLIQLSGRSLDETAVVLIENYTAVGYGYYRLHHELVRFEAFKKTLSPIPEDAVIRGFIREWMQKHAHNIRPIPMNTLPGDDEPLYSSGETPL
jgi:DNA polymerase-3 subunit epsilon